MNNYYRIMLGEKSKHAEECFRAGFIGMDFSVHQDLSKEFSSDWRDFNKKFIPVFQQRSPSKTKISAGLACGALWTLGKGINSGDIILSPNGKGSYYAGEVTGPYEYHPNKILFHRRPVRWYPNLIDKSLMSLQLRNSAGGPGTIRQINAYSSELAQLLGGHRLPTIMSTDETVEDPSVFALERHLEDFLVQNWRQTELGKSYDIFEEEGEPVGQQYATDTGPIDILAVSKDKKELLVVELKKGRASDSVVGQIQRYMGYVMEALAEETQTVRGVIIALDDDTRIKRALKVAQNIEFYRYQITFKLQKG
jgi:restriction system protein